MSQVSDEESLIAKIEELKKMQLSKSELLGILNLKRNEVS